MLTMNTKSLQSALALCKGAIDAGNSIPILSYVRITSAGRITVTGTDMETAFVLPVGGSGDAWDVVVPHKQLAGLVAGYKGGTVTMEPADEGKRVRVQVGGMSSHLPPLPVEDFPTDLDTGALPNAMTLPAGMVRDAFAPVVHAISTEETRYYLNGVYMHMTSGGDLVTVATDGHRLAKVETPVNGDSKAPGAIVPSNFVACMLAMLGKSADSALVEWSDSRMRVTLNGGVLVGKMIDGTYPEYQRVIPRDKGYVVTAPSAALAATVKRVASVGRSNSKPVKMTMGACCVDISAHDVENGSASESVAATLTGAAGFKIGFQARYLRDVLAWCGDTVEMAFADGSAPAVFRPVGDASRLFVLMPMRV